MYDSKKAYKGSPRYLQVFYQWFNLFTAQENIPRLSKCDLVVSFIHGFGVRGSGVRGKPEKLRLTVINEDHLYFGCDETTSTSVRLTELIY